jgi:2-polyprenyl-6-methoxyphenol hydroxylase-like FAD-dependent oxidoreductase
MHALSSALVERARALGVEVREGADVRHHRRNPDSALVETAGGSVRGRLLVAADGLTSAVRRREGLELATAGSPRYGLRRHFARAPWSDAVESTGEGAEAYDPTARAGIASLRRATRGFRLGDSRAPPTSRASRPTEAGERPVRQACARALDRSSSRETLRGA